MNLSRRSILVLCLILLPFVTTAQPSGDTDNQAMDRIFEAIPFEGQLSETVEELHSQFSQNPFGMGPDQNQQMMKEFTEAYATDSLLADARETFQQNHSSDYADSAASWINKEIIHPILEAENEFYTIQGIRNRIVNRHELEQDPASENRIELINTLEQSKSVTETEIESQVIIFRALISAFSELSDRQSLDASQIEGVVGNFRNQASTQINREVNNQLLLMYHGIANDLLEEYIHFYETEAGEWLNDTKSESIHSAYQDAGDRFLNTIKSL